MVEAYSSEVRHVLGAMEDFLLKRQWRKLRSQRGQNIAMVYVDILAT